MHYVVEKKNKQKNNAGDRICLLDDKNVLARTIVETLRCIVEMVRELVRKRSDESD